MLAAIADTHAIIWYLYGDARLSITARNFIENAVTAGNTIVVSAITPIEMVYLIEKRRIASESLTRLVSALDNPLNVFEAYPIDVSIARTLSRVDRAQIPDMPDRIIAATGMHLGIPIISRDGKIKASDITTIW